MSTLLAPVAEALQRLDQRRHVSPARLELSHERSTGVWVAQIIADPLRRPLVGTGEIPETAIGRLAGHIDALDWRKVKR